MERGRKSPVTGSLSTGSRWNFSTLSFLSFRFFSGVLLSLGCLFVSLLFVVFLVSLRLLAFFLVLPVRRARYLCCPPPRAQKMVELFFLRRGGGRVHDDLVSHVPTQPPLVHILFVVMIVWFFVHRNPRRI